MKTIDIESFTNLDDADDWLYFKLDSYDSQGAEVKGEIIKIDGKWRASVITDFRQGDLFD